MLSCYGHGDGASGRGMDAYRLEYGAYNKAYEEGRKTRKRMNARYAKEFGITNREIRASVLR